MQGLHRRLRDAVDMQGSANAELYEGLLMLQHRGQDSAGMVTTDWDRFCEHRANGLVREVWPSQSRMDKLRGRLPHNPHFSP